MPRATAKPTPSNAELAKDFLAHARRLGRSSDTVYSYGRHLTRFVQHLDGMGTSATVCTPAQLSDFVYERRQQRGDQGLAVEPKPSTVKTRISVLRAFFTYLVDHRELRPTNPAKKLELPQVDNEDPHPILDGNWIKLWSSDLTDGERVAFGLCFFAGLRRQEATRLAVAEVVDLPNLRLVNFWRKGGKRMKMFPLASSYAMFCTRRPDLVVDPSWFLDAMGRLRKERATKGRKLLLPFQDERRSCFITNAKHKTPEEFIQPQLLAEKLKWAQSRAGVYPNQLVGPHALRHGFGTAMMNMLGEQHVVKVSRLMHHTDTRVTMRYLATKEDPLEELLEGPLAEGQPQEEALPADLTDDDERWAS